MPIFKYLVLNKSNIPQYIEIEQPVNEEPLVEHPLTGEPIERVLYAPTITLNHSSIREKKTLSADHLKKHGFSVFQKNKNSKDYTQTLGENPNINPSNGWIILKIWETKLVKSQVALRSWIRKSPEFGW